MPDTADAPAPDEAPALAVLPISNAPPVYRSVDEMSGRFGAFGGQYIPETLSLAHAQLAEAYVAATQDPEFRAELARLGRDVLGRATPLTLATNLTRRCGGAQIWLKREDLQHTGSHKLNNAMGQALLARRLGKPRVIAETGAGQHGVATATACAMMGLECVVYMGAVDVARQAPNVARMKLLGARVVAVESGSKTLRAAVNEAMRDWVANVETTHYIVGSAIGPHPFPTMVRDFQAVIGREARAQMLDQAGRLPDAVVACVGGGSNAIGSFHAFVGDEGVRLVGAEAGGDGVDTPRHSSTLAAGSPGVLHGTRTYVMQDPEGQVLETHSISAGLDYAGVGPEHAWLKESGRAEYVSVTDTEALEAFQALAQSEGIIPALESSHAVAHGMALAAQMDEGQAVLITVSGRGDKDLDTVTRRLGL